MDTNRQNFYSGLLFIAIGLAFAAGTLRSLPIGTAASMGPGYFPLLLSGLLALLGAWTLLGSLKAIAGNRHGQARYRTPLPWRPLLCVLAANFAFGILLKGIPAWGIPAQGLIVSIYALIGIASLASKPYRASQALLLATILAVGCYVIFIRFMGLPVPAWPSYF